MRQGRRTPRAFRATLLVLLAGCVAPAAWDGTVDRWGTLREVLRDGRSEARVEIASVVRSQHAVGLGAVEGLAGEVTVLDGRVWVTRASLDGRTTTEAGDGVRATLLALARVERWAAPIPLSADPGLAGLETAVARAIEQAGLSSAETVPFRVEGELTALEAHVLRGACPLAPGADPGAPDAPLRLQRARARGILVGFFTTLPPGELAHHGQRVHVHVLLEEGLTAHVDAVDLPASSTLILPERGR